MGKAVEIAENTGSTVRSFKRSDLRIRTRIASKYGGRRSERVRQIIHEVTRQVIEEAKATKRAVVFEDIEHIRRLHKRETCKEDHPGVA